MGLQDQASHLTGNCTKSFKEQNVRLGQGKQHLRDTCPKGKLEFKFFLALSTVRI